MSKKRIPVFLDTEHEDALKELKICLPVDEDIKDSPMIRYALLELLNRVRKEINFEKKVLDSLSLLEIMTNAKLEQDHTKIQDLFSSDVYQEAVTMSKKVVRNNNYRFKNRKDESKKEEKRKVKSVQEDVKKERDFNDIVSQYLPK
ncbi:hypothetical protein ABG980_14135 [Enterococcus casseliflavus]|uniref:hypothetical protein n=1 Tax=Enterococcus casseliflavus TaxID=37734 RepID=UPI00232E9ED2|nr:hypothetical protein [Enterococcus casseliflavus]MDB1696799.1 hypothetical protein [Enterococcus casseliflavus]MDB1700300.1 hypothetical protein [Enterococcus casseliflavus]MDB1703300.1 hypothetical protein [Enterococcus casseliflavus]MDB1707153.1 hypothetical protein [Enterococcus casseliflavus]